jgi:hypothetical protein
MFTDVSEDRTASRVSDAEDGGSTFQRNFGKHLAESNPKKQWSSVAAMKTSNFAWSVSNGKLLFGLIQYFVQFSTYISS